MNLILLASAALSLFGPTRADIQINLNVKNGDTISGETTFKATVGTTTTVTINQVEMYVNDDLRDTETSTPYTFQFDTIAENDGDVRVKFKAYTSANQTAENTVTLHIDNQMSKGAEFHVKAAEDALSDSKWSDAINQGRIGLKLDSKSVGARIALGRAYLAMKIFDKSQKFAEDAVALDPKNIPALKLLAGIQVERAFATIAKEGADQNDVSSAIADAFKGAVTADQKSLDIAVDVLPQPTGDDVSNYVDTALRASRYSLAISTLQPLVKNDPGKPALVNRLAYAEIMAGRFPEAFQTLKDAQTLGKLNAYGYALLGLSYIQLNDQTSADAAMKSAIENDPDDLGVRTVQTYIALKQNKTTVFSGLANDLGKEEGQRPEVNYFLMSLADRQLRYGDARKYFERAILAKPGLSEAYVEQANYQIGLALKPKADSKEKEQALKLAGVYFETALVSHPEAADAFAGLTVLAMMAKNATDAVKFAEASRDAATEQAIGHYAAAGAYQLAGRYTDAHNELKKAGELDKKNLEGIELPKAMSLWIYMQTAGRQAVITPPK